MHCALAYVHFFSYLCAAINQLDRLKRWKIVDLKEKMSLKSCIHEQ